MIKGCGNNAGKQSSDHKDVQASDAVKNDSASVFSDRSTWLLGYFKPDKLSEQPYASWYVTGYEDYQIDSDAVNSLLDVSKDKVSIKIIMGTWCPDSRREVPRMMRLLDIWKLPMTQVTFIGVDKDKKAAIDGYGSLKIEKVPTFIIYKNNIEAGRIIERPATSLEQEMVNILTITRHE